MAKSCAYKKAFELTCFRICKKRTIIVTSARAESLRNYQNFKKKYCDHHIKLEKERIEEKNKNILITTRKEAMKNAF